jgi:hypothetical protein
MATSRKTVPLHHVRPARRRARVPLVEPAAPVYEAGHFTALVRRHNWPPRFEPQMQRTREVEQSEISRINRERRQALGDTGTIVGLTQRADDLIRQRVMSQRVVR